MLKRLLGLALLFASAASAQIVVSPQSIVVNPRPSFGVDVWLDRDTSGDGAPSYQVGDEIRISVRPAEDSYVYVFDVKPNGEVTQIFPNRFDSDNFVRGGRTVTLPPSGARYVFNIAPPRGLSKVIAVASRTQLDTRQLARFDDEDDLFAHSTIGEEGFVQGFRIIVNPIPQADWVTDTALYYVGDRPAQAAYGTLQLRSTPSGAEAYVDGSFVGYTPLSFGTRPGRHEVRFVLAGYEEFTTSVNVSPGRTEPVNATLQQRVRAGTATFTSSPSGADVFVDGRYVGTTPTGSIRFQPGQYEATFELPGYQSQTIGFRVSQDRDTVVDASLRGTSSVVVIQANVGGATVFLDGAFAGNIPNGTGRLELRDVQPGRHEIVVMAPRYSTYVTTFTLEPGRTVELNVRQSRF
ncbi:MAG TPA: PEGA domain-containing protein [Trueperaceae bacterium]|nr:PEGA domain-containing protein [Trueperaceae bacterium]